jgi:hypothetical protein
MPSSLLRRWLLAMAVFVALLLGFVAWAANYYVEPILQRRIGVLIVTGSDSLYRYRIAKLDASLFGGDVEVDSLQMEVDSVRYKLMAVEGRLPAITFRVDMPHGHLRGVGLWSLLVGRKVQVDELFTGDARIELWRNGRDVRRDAPTSPLWKTIRPGISGITLNKLRLEGVRFAYRYITDSLSLQVKFDTCTALIRDIRIDSLASVDPERIGFCRYVNLHFYDLKYRSADSMYKLKAKVIDYNSEGHVLRIEDFKLQPTLKDKESFYNTVKLQRQMTVIGFDLLELKGFRMENFFRDNAVRADSLVITSPYANLYLDRTMPPTLEGKSGNYPNQLLLNSGYEVDIRAMAIRNGSLEYTERGKKSGRAGTVRLSALRIAGSNITNIPSLIARDSTWHMHAEGLAMGNTPAKADFGFDLRGPEGRFTADGTIGNSVAAQLNGVSEPLAFMHLQRFDMEQLRFSLRGDEYGATGTVRMRYRNLSLELQKEDPQTGSVQTKGLLTRVVNKYTLLHNNPDASGREYFAGNVQQSRLMTQTFFGLIWKSIFSGMQTIMTNSGEPLP